MLVVIYTRLLIFPLRQYLLRLKSSLLHLIRLLSLFFVVMRGEYDALLPWPFQQKVTLVLMDQTYGRHVSDTFRPDPTSSSFRKPRNEMNIASGCPLFVSLATLDSGCYIKDDTMFVKVVVDTSDVARPDKR